MKQTAWLAMLLVSPSPAVTQQRGLVPIDYYSYVAVNDVAISPTGGYVAFVVTTVNEEKNSRHREIWMQALENGRPRGTPFRFTGPTEESSSPTWSPDGSLLAFSSRRGDDENAIWFTRVEGPGGEAFHVDGVDGSPTWSPDGRWIAFTRAPRDTVTQPRPQREGWIAPDAITTTLDAKRFDGRVITSMRYKRDGVLTLRPDPAVQTKSQLFVVPAEGGEARQLTDLPFGVGGGGGFGGGGGLTWSPDSRVIVFTADPMQDNEYNDENTSEIYAVSLDGGEARVLTTNPGSESSPVFSASGRRLAFRSTPDRGEQTDIMVVDVRSDGTFAGEPRSLTSQWDLSPGAPEWTPDGRTIRFSAGLGGNAHLLAVPADGGGIRQVTRGDRQLGSIATTRDGRIMAYTATDAMTPAEVFVARSDGSNEQRISSFNDAWLARLTIMPAERLTWTVNDGTEIEGWVVKPVGFQAGRKYPMILKVHGGPHSSYGNTFFHTFHVLSNSGFFVLYSNPRGPSGSGHEFQYATRGKWGELDKEDYLNGVAAAIAKYPEIDENRVGVSGGSYGGYMTNWLTSTTDRFAAAVTSRSIANWESWYGASDVQGLTEYEFYGPPWEQRELYRRLSPISYVENVTAPTLIIHSENDYRTPIGDGEQWFMALMKRHIPVELVRYPRSSHGLSRTGEPWLLVDRLERIRSWFTYWLIDQRVAAGMP